ncbi:MAG: hypothetical protein JXR32_07760, partial [Anaerolineaceae bacterium]|nr:hypothetical protein [Anaerolineaceae bacterium]
WLGTALIYSFTGCILLSITGFFRARSIWALFLSGAVFGWLIEGLVVQTLYDDLPLSLSFTGLAWHALISVLVGWWMLRRALRSGWRPAVGLSAAIGLSYGLWAIHWWLALDGGVSSMPDFVVYSLVPTLLLMAAYWIVDQWLPQPFTLNRWMALAAVILLAAYFTFVTVPTAGLAVGILPILLLIALFTLRRNRQVEAAEVIEALPSPPGQNYLALIAIPALADLVYALATILDLRWNTNWILYIITTPAGFIMFILSLIQTWRKEVNHKSTQNSKK